MLQTPQPDRFSIVANGLAKRYNREWIFRKLTYTFEQGKTYAITGPNGSGKSTLLQVLWGQSPPSSGTVSYVQKERPLPIEDVYRHITIATPYMDLVDEFTLEEQLAFHSRLKPLRPGVSIDMLIEKMYLQNSRKKQIGNFSSGMRQRVKLCLAFSTEADVIFLDEPGTNLDKTAFDWYLRQLDEVQEKSLLFIASNNPEEYSIADAVLNILDFK
jgi:ABC-type multidrug transport system ATPase subunit